MSKTEDKPESRYGDRFEEKNTLGNFKGHILDWYDGPLFTTCINEKGEHFFEMLFDSGDDYDQFLYIPVSINRKNKILKGIISLREMITEAEFEPLYLVNKYYGEKCGQSTVKEIKKSDIKESNLPSKKTYNNYLEE